MNVQIKSGGGVKASLNTSTAIAVCNNNEFYEQEINRETINLFVQQSNRNNNFSKSMYSIRFQKCFRSLQPYRMHERY